MTDAADSADLDLDPTDVDVEPAEPTVAERLLLLQRIDTESDQLIVRRERLPEREELATRTNLATAWERRRKEINARLEELSEAIEEEEKTGAELSTHRARLEAQLKTVIAPREAEALMHEIATIEGQRDELDDKELAALEEQAALDDERAEHIAAEDSLRAALKLADEALASACAAIDAELADLAGRRTEDVGSLDTQAVARYEAKRKALGVAVAQLKGHRCEGCHLDLSAAEVDTAKDEAAVSGFTDCPQCGRMLIV